MVSVFTLLLGHLAGSHWTTAVMPVRRGFEARNSVAEQCSGTVQRNSAAEKVMGRMSTECGGFPVGEALWE